MEQMICKQVNRFRRLLGKKKLPLIVIVDDLPETHDYNTVYVTGIKGKYFYCSMECPCGCGDIIELNLNHESRPRWSIKWHHNGTLSLSPSINRTTGCKSHFFYKEGIVIWCEPYQS